MSGWLEAFIVIAAVAIVIQMAILLAMFLQVRVAIEQFTRIAADLQNRIDPILLRTNRILEDSEDRIASIMGDAAEITRVARGSAQKIDRVFTDAVERLRVQIIRADHILTGDARSNRRIRHEIPPYALDTDSAGVGDSKGHESRDRYDSRAKPAARARSSDAGRRTFHLIQPRGPREF